MTVPLANKLFIAKYGKELWTQEVMATWETQSKNYGVIICYPG